MHKNSLYQVDVADVAWVKSSFSHQNGACVELAEIPGGVAMRDSKDTDRPELRYTRAELAAFIAGVKAGEFDRFL